MRAAPSSSSRLAVLAVVAVCLGGCGSAERPRGSSDVARDPAPVKAVPDETRAPRLEQGSVVETLPIDQLVGELVMTKLVGPVASRDELDAIARLEVGSIILFGPSVVDRSQLRSLIASLNVARGEAARRAGLPEGVLISVDQEGGAIRNVPFAPPELTQPELAAIGSIARARTEAVATGRGLREAGISMDLGPVADLVQQPNRTMAGRSFGSDPVSVAPLVGATVAGLQQGGVAATVKHFPGFGASTANSDEAVATVARTREQLLEEELRPFRAAIAADVDAVMVSHGVHEALGSTLPGALDPKIATGLLRDELGFGGVAMTDSMNARGFREAWGDTVPRACPVAVGAGIDLLLLTGTMETARLCRRRILDAVRDGSLSEERVREAAARVIKLRAKRAG